MRRGGKGVASRELVPLASLAAEPPRWQHGGAGGVSRPGLQQPEKHQGLRLPLTHLPRPPPAAPAGPLPAVKLRGGGSAQPLPPAADSPTAERGCGPLGAASSAEQSSARPRAKRAARPPRRSILAVPGAPCSPTAAHVTGPARRKGASPGRLVQAPAFRGLPGTAGSRHRAPPARPGPKTRSWPGPVASCGVPTAAASGGCTGSRGHLQEVSPPGRH